ncbi:MAG: carotenoid biosynthesis protein [Chloroflexi bacterium]|nr:MAG: carotenoid biosynthesis protein [Chloroflexota bacterium]
MNPVFLFLEVAATILFVGAAAAALRRGRLPFLELLSAAAFGLLLEEGDQLIFQTYHYSEDWVLVLDRAPVVIGLTWALLIAGAMRITDALGVRRWTAPFVDAVLVIMLDLAFDAVAIRMGMWTWVDVGLDQGWFGVPAGNFYAWLFVTLGFSLLSRWLRDAAVGRPQLEWLQLGVPIPAFAILLTSIIPFATIMELTNAEPGGGLWLFGLTLVVFVAVAGVGTFGRGRQAPDGKGSAMVDLRLAFFTRFSMHGFFLLALLVMGLATSQPVLLLTSLALLVADIGVSRLVDRRREEAAARSLDGQLAAIPATVSDS